MSEVDKRSFWAYFFQALAGAEAGLVPTKDVRHTEPQLQVVDDVTHRMVRQEGLLQLTYMDQERYGCDFDWEKDKDLPEHDPAKTILQPRNNLLCGVSIIKNQLVDQHKPLLELHQLLLHAATGNGQRQGVSQADGQRAGNLRTPHRASGTE